MLPEEFEPATPADPCLIPHGHWDQHENATIYMYMYIYIHIYIYIYGAWGSVVVKALRY